MRWRRSPASSINRKPVASRNDRSPRTTGCPASLPTRSRRKPDPAQRCRGGSPVQYAAVDPAPIEAHGYSKVGPGPMAAIRFKWTVRADNGEYYVDETIGENSDPDRHRPDDDGMPRSDWSTTAKPKRSRRFEQLKSEMSRTRRRRQSGAQGQRRDRSSPGRSRPISAGPENPSWRDRRRRGAGCRRPW